MIDWYKNQTLLVKIILPLIVVAIIILVIIFVPKYVGPGENCIFITERSNLHNEYYITVVDVNMCDNIYVLKNKDDNEKSELIGTSSHYLEVCVIIEHQNIADPKENHILDLDDFKIKDHTGVQIKNINIFSKENALALETNNFSTRKPIADYSWIGKSIEPGESFELKIYFEFSKSLSVDNSIMVLETDLFGGRRKNKAATDIVLAYRENCVEIN